MAVVYLDSFEEQDTAQSTSNFNQINCYDGTSTGTITVGTGWTGSGQCVKFNSGASNGSVGITLATDASNTPAIVLTSGIVLYVKFKFLIPSSAGWPSTQGLLTRYFGENVVEVSVTTGGKLIFGLTSELSPQLVQDQWYTFESKTTIGGVYPASNTACEVRLDGTTFGSGTSSNSYQSAGSFTVGLGVPNGGSYWGANKEVWIDDLGVYNSSGSANNTWPGTERVQVMLPLVSDFSIGNWVAGAGGTTNLFEALNNTPPVGVAPGSRTNTSQIKNTTASVSYYEGTTATYTSAGIEASDTIHAIATRLASGNDTAASGGSYTVEFSNNPTGGASGTFLANRTASATSTYPTGWRNNGTVSGGESAPGGGLARLDNPTVSLSSGTRIKLGKQNTTALSPDICALNLIVEYTPVTPEPPQPISVFNLGFGL